MTKTKLLKYAGISLLIAIIHFGTLFVVTILIFVGEFTPPQGGDVPLTQEQRNHREQIKPYEKAFLALLKGTGRVLYFPLIDVSKWKADRRSHYGLIVLNSSLWGIATSSAIAVIQRRKSLNVKDQRHTYV